MVITSLVENTSRKGLPAEHGLSLHIRLDDGRQVLFDMGQRRLFAENAVRLGIDLGAVDTAVVSHGHYDHGGGIRAFLDINTRARVYISRAAFEPHYSLRDNGLAYIGIDSGLKDNARIVPCNGVTGIGHGMTLFDGVGGSCLRPPGNRLLFGREKGVHDDFCHEQNLIIKESGRTVLFAGCAHSGIVNIMRRAEEVAECPVTHVFAGMHLVKSGLTDEAEAAFIGSLAEKLARFTGCRYFTMHCTGQAQYAALKAMMGDAIDYLSCGDSVTV